MTTQQQPQPSIGGTPMKRVRINVETSVKQEVAEMAERTPGPWTWRENEFRPKYMQQLRNGSWRAKPGRKSRDSWVALLTGPLRDPPIAEIHRDEWDYPHIIALRWGQIRGGSLVNVMPNPADASLIAAAPEMLAALEAISDAWANKKPLAWQPEWHLQLLDQARAAIAKAKGGE